MIEIPALSIEGFPYSIYSVEYQAGINKPSELSVTFFNKTGTYTHPELGFGNLYEFKFNNFSFKGYAFDSTIENKEPRVMNVKFKDQTAILRTYSVFLIGEAFRSGGIDLPVTAERLIRIGRETPLIALQGGSSVNINDLESYQDYINQLYLKTNDKTLEGYPLNSSVMDTTALSMVFEKDAENISKTEILPKEYYFSDLIKLLRQYIDTDVRVDVAANFPLSSTGILTEVLDDVCNQLGLMYFFENGKLNIVDVSGGISPVFPDNLPNLTSSSWHRTFEGTVARTSTLQYNMNGDEAATTIGISGDDGLVYRGTLSLSALKLTDIGLNENGDLVQTLAGYASNSLQQLIELYDSTYGYGITFANATNLVNKYIQTMGLYVKGVFKNTSIENLLGSDWNKDLSEEAKAELNKNGAILVFGYYNEEKAQEMAAYYDLIAKDYLGRYFYHKTTLPDFTEFYGGPEGVDYGKRTRKDKNPLRTLAQKYVNPFKSYTIPTDGTGFSGGLNTFLFAQRNPPYQLSAPLNVIHDVLNPISPVILGYNETLAEKYKTWYEGQYGKPPENLEKTAAFILHTPSVSVVTSHKLNESDEYGPDAYPHPLGLRSKMAPCITVTINGSSLEIIGPALSTSIAADLAVREYVVGYSLQRGDPNNNKAIPKIEESDTKQCVNPLARASHEHQAVNVLDYDLTRRNIIIARNSIGEQYKKISNYEGEYLENIKENLASLNEFCFSTPPYFEEKDYEIAGLYSGDLSIASGLLSFSISWDSKGLFTNFKIGNTEAKPPEVPYRMFRRLGRRGIENRSI